MAIGHDLVHAARLLRRAPLFTAAAVLSLAVGMAGAAAVFAVADGLFLRLRPAVADPDRLVDVGRTQDGDGFDNLSYPNYVDLRDRNTVFSGLAAVRMAPEPLGLGDANGAERVFGLVVSANYFDVLGTPIARGRTFRPEEDQDGAPLVTVIGHALWTNRFHADPNIVGSTIRLNGSPFTIVGVAPEGFTGATVFASDLWVPIGAFPRLSGSRELLQMRAGVWLQCIGRLKDSVTFAQAQAVMSALGRALESEFPDDNAGKGIAVARYAPLPAPARAGVAGFLALLGALVGLILLIACTNVAGMLLARGVERGRDVAIRLALGAGGGRIVRDLLVESALLALLAAGVGILASLWIVQLLRTLPLVQIAALPIALDFRVSWVVVAFSAALGGLTGLAFGLAPALHLMRSALTPLRSDASTYTPTRLRWRQAFLVGQIALSVLLLVVAALLVRSLRLAATVDPGFRTDHVEIVGLDMRLAGYTPDSGEALETRVLERVRQLPDVESASFVRVLPLTFGGMGLGRLQIPGRPDDDRSLDRTDWNVVSGGYFETMGVAMVRGRTFGSTDRGGAPRVAVINETFAERAWPGEDALGKTLLQAAPPGSGRLAEPLEIVGIVRNTKSRSLSDPDRPLIYVPYTQQYMPDLTLVLRHRGDTSVLPAVRAALSAIDPDLPIVRAAALDIITAAGLLPNRIAAWLSGTVGSVAVALAVVGIYGLMAFSVSQRRREIGVRMALGAGRRDVLGLLLRQGVVLVGLGALLGLAAAGAGSRLLSTLLFGLTPLDPASFTIGALVFVALGLLATAAPAHRAASTNPVDALRMTS